ncbi:MAG: nucleoside/nucleotide kinase family protein [Ilumatobacteraceae bacterium]
MGVRRIIGIVGPPGCGKSTIAQRMVGEHPGTHVAVPMDGFHLAQRELRRLGRHERKGAPDTFDVDGYVSLLARLRDAADRTVYAPVFDRNIEEPIANAIAVEPHHTTVVTEGNYLLHTMGGWEAVRPLLDACWYVECDERLRIERLLARHVAHGRSPEEAQAWVRRVDGPNADLVRSRAHVADLVVRSDGPTPS